MTEKIEILGLELFETLKEEMDIVERMQQYFCYEMGWHYHLDLAWLIKEISCLPKGSIILDAGAGYGLAQFILSELGYNVISVDFTTRTFPMEGLSRYNKLFYFLNDQSQTFRNRYTQHLQQTYDYSSSNIFKNLKERLYFPFKRRKHFDTPEKITSFIGKKRLIPKDLSKDVLQKDAAKSCGRIFIYKCDLKDMALLPDNFVDGVVSISALEHNDNDDFEKCMDELIRVTKPGGIMSVTVSASQSEDWFHQPSKGWCYSETSLKNLFRLPSDVPSNYSEKDILFENLRMENNELHKKLASCYYKSGNNGMPWGKWDPQYQPVGIVKLNNTNETR